MKAKACTKNVEDGEVTVKRWDYNSDDYELYYCRFSDRYLKKMEYRTRFIAARFSYFSFKARRKKLFVFLRFMVTQNRHYANAMPSTRYNHFIVSMVFASLTTYVRQSTNHQMDSLKFLFTGKPKKKSQIEVKTKCKQIKTISIGMRWKYKEKIRKILGKAIGEPEKSHWQWK